MEFYKQFILISFRNNISYQQNIRKAKISRDKVIMVIIKWRIHLMMTLEKFSVPGFDSEQILQAKISRKSKIFEITTQLDLDGSYILWWRLKNCKFRFWFWTFLFLWNFWINLFPYFFQNGQSLSSNFYLKKILSEQSCKNSIQFLR